MKKNLILIFLVITYSIVLNACTSKYIDDAPRDRKLQINGILIPETKFGGVERWYAIDKYGQSNKVRFQVGYFKKNQTGFILYEGGTIGEEAVFLRQGLDLRWDWGNDYRDGSSGYRYSLVIQPDGTGLYYDFSTSSNGLSKPRGIYEMRKF